MKSLLLIALGTFLFVVYFIPVAEGSEAKILLESVDNKTSYTLNPDVLEEISQLQGPIRVIAAVGNARVGKSTTLNLISHILSGRSENSVEEIFKTGDSFEPVTRNVWAHIIQPQNEDGSILLLDVEGTNLGDDTVTDRLSMFTAMMSSSLNVFALHIVGNGDIGFLYRIARLSDLVFKNKNILENFPKLRIAIRTELDIPSDDYIRDEIFKTQEKGQIIQKYFPKDSIEVSHIPTVNGKLLKDVMKLSKPDWKAFESLADRLMNSQEKRSFEGSSIDGTALVQLAEKVVEAMNADGQWKDFGDVYATIERDICRRSYEKHIKPVLMETSRGIGQKMVEALDEFKKECVLENEIATAREDLNDTFNEKSEQEEEEKRRQEEERRRQEEERRRQEEERRRKEEEEKKRREEENSTWETVKSYAKYLGAFVIGGYMFSDEDLKTNVTILPRSEFDDIGLRGVCWEWNEDAKKSFGLTGESCGVIAQEVEMLYPWAVIRGKDGYLRVQYDTLRQMISVARNKNLKSA
ncbi:hypothetical protein ACROYT_G024960 [Oculina patagonica]